jgi:hypothetical protein
VAYIRAIDCRWPPLPEWRFIAASLHRFWGLSEAEWYKYGVSYCCFVIGLRHIARCGKWISGNNLNDSDFMVKSPSEYF